MAFVFSRSFIDAALTYDQYRKGLYALLKHPPADEAGKKMIAHTARNQVLMDDYDQSYRVGDELRSVMQNVPPLNWIVITEGWCGDAAFNVPMLAILENLYPAKIHLRLFLRDKNPELIDAFLTEGGRSIPKLILLDEQFKVKGTWGPRPAPLMKQMAQWKENGDQFKELIAKTQDWYNTDATRTLQQELASVLSAIN